jgi:hypothetical protein
MSEGLALLLTSKEYSYLAKKPNTFSNKKKKVLDLSGELSILRTNVRNRNSNREVIEYMSSNANYRLQNPRKLFRAVAILALAASFSVASLTGSFATNESGAELEYITVNSGETLWQLANQHAPAQDPRDWIAEVVAVNALTTVDLEPGQRLALPR